MRLSIILALIPAVALASECPPEAIAAWFRAQPVGWYRCGEKVADIDASAAEWASQLEVACQGDARCIHELVGIVANESRFDECAVGRPFRKWAAETLAPSGWPWKVKRRLGDRMLRLSRLTISLPRDDVRRAMLADGVQAIWHERGIDTGPCQILLHKWSAETLDAHMSVGTGLALCADHWRHLGEHYGTATPSSYWPGKKSDRYKKRVERLAERVCN